MSGTADPCPYCATPMANCGAPIWEDYCPNKECTGHRDEFMEEFRRGREAFAADQSMRDAAPDMYAACSDAFDFLGGVDGNFDLAKCSSRNGYSFRGMPNVPASPRSTHSA
jgi:hypothetical protein